MAKVSRIQLYLKSEYGEYYEVHYNAKGAHNFSVKGLPDDFHRVTDIMPFGYPTEAELQNAISRGVLQYKDFKQAQRKVIVYKASATAELTMHKENSNGDYRGNLNGISRKLDSFGHGSEVASFGITYRVMMEIDRTNKKQYHHINEDGSLGFSKNITTREQVMDWSEEREAFFENIYSSMREMVLKMSKFIDQDADAVALLISGNQILLD